jgi:hypothetical protein
MTGYVSHNTFSASDRGGALVCDKIDDIQYWEGVLYLRYVVLCLARDSRSLFCDDLNALREFCPPVWRAVPGKILLEWE